MKDTAKKPRAATTDASRQNAKPPDSTRETVESIVVAFVLAFLFRTFEAEAFVIPTGSMAPTLYGQQRDVYCTQCGTRFAVGVNSPPSQDAEIRDGSISHEWRSKFAICPNANCRFPNDVLEHETFAGDRILVNKFPYEFGEPQRWDVVVFKFPEQAKINYIKRLAGLPGESLIIEGGNVKVRPLNAGPEEGYRIARKPPEKQRHLQIPVHDNDHPARALLEAGWPECWDNVDGTGWKADPRSRTFQTDVEGNHPETSYWLRYTHYLPTGADWRRALAGESVAERAQPQLIRESYAYNSRVPVGQWEGLRGELPDFQLGEPEQWVGDLTLTCSIEVLAAGGELTFELVRSKRRYLCHVNLQTGSGAFQYVHEQGPGPDDSKPDPAGKPFETGMNRPGTYSVSFTDVDDRLCFWVNDRLVGLLDIEDEDDAAVRPQMPPVEQTDSDTTPVGIAARGAAVRVAHLRIERDVFYRNESHRGHFDRANPYILKDDPDDQNDEFLMLGDNSPRSNDSRLWQTTSTVPRRLLIGKAFYVYWPHGVPFLNNGRGFPVGKYNEPRPRDGQEAGPPLPKFSVPFYPQIERMHRIR